MKTLAVVLSICVTVVLVATQHELKEYVLDKQRLDIQQQQLQLDILKYINAQQEKMEGNNPQPGGPLYPFARPHKPSMEVRPRL